MAVPYPASLIQCPIMGWREESLPNVVQFDTEVGAQKRRRRTTNSGYMYTAQYKMSHANMTTFWTFYEDDLQDGVLRFDITHPRTGTVVTVQFEGVPSIQQVAPKLYTASFTLRAFV